MKQKDIDIYEILKDMPKGIELYTPMCGRVDLTWLATNKEAGEAIGTENRNGEFTFNKEGKYFDDGEVLLFPSNEMRDWSKFFKKGDVLEYVGDKKLQGTCTFEKYEDETKTRFFGRFVKEKEVLNPNLSANFRTVDWVKKHNPTGYIRFVEERLGGKLNRKTLEVEKAQPEFKDGDIVMSDSGTIVLVRGNSSTRYIYYHAFMCNEDIYINQVEGEFFSRISRIKRFATDSEKQQLFSALAKEGKAWDSEKKQIVDLKPAFELGKLYVFKEEDEDGELTIIGKLIDKNESEDTLRFGYQYEIETEKLVTDQAFDLRISTHKELREATEGEAITFQEACTQWEKQKEAKEHPVFKPFDKVLVRNGDNYKWLPAFFVRVRGEAFGCRCNVLLIHSGKAAYFTSCIPFEGNEHLAFTDKDFNDLPF